MENSRVSPLSTPAHSHRPTESFAIALHLTTVFCASDLSTSTAEQVAQLQNHISSAKSDHSKLLSQITTLEESLTTEQSTSSSAQTNLASQLVSLQTELSTAQQTLTERASYVDSLESQLTEEKGRVLEKETVAFGEETEKKDALDRVRQLEEDLLAVANWQDQKSCVSHPKGPKVKNPPCECSC